MHDLPSHTDAAGAVGVSASTRTLIGIGLVLVASLAAAAIDVPQHGRDLLVETQADSYESHDGKGPDDHEHAIDHDAAAISLGAVFLGAMTSIGNGPNFMVKAIAEQPGVRMPSFFGYVLYSACILLPVFAAASFLFL